MNTHRIEYSSYWVAYFDLLGFENRVRSESTVRPTLEEYQTALHEIQCKKTEITSPKWFSDTFLLYAPDHSEKSFVEIDEACQRFFAHMVRWQVPLRGCLHVGNFYEDAEKGVLIGPALVDAYKLAECQDWLGFVLSPDAVTRREQYGASGDLYRQYDVPVDHSESIERLDALTITHPSLHQGHCRPHEWWMCLHGMENDALKVIDAKSGGHESAHAVEAPEEDERNRVLRKYRNSKKFLLHLHPELAQFVQGEYGPIPLRNRDVMGRIRDTSWHLP
ncbi:MAG: hypothetical protein JW993_17930 [Sedimentisphaerales bacterium]|nr:hypothetical protein [Sedimentisphaerales bacterium]